MEKNEFCEIFFKTIFLSYVRSLPYVLAMKQ